MAMSCLSVCPSVCLFVCLSFVKFKSFATWQHLSASGGSSYRLRYIRLLSQRLIIVLCRL